MKCINKFFIQWASIFCLSVVCNSSVLAQQLFIDHCKHGCPSSNETDDVLLVRHLFAASVLDNGLAQWVAYRVFAETVGVASLLPRYWQADRLIQSQTAIEESLDDAPRFIQPDLSDSQDRDYRVNEVTLLSEDRGRLAPMTSFANTPYWNELNMLSNMAALPADLKLGSWARLDQAINEISTQGGYYFVVSGPVYMSDTQQHSIEDPDAFFKIVATGDRIASFLFTTNIKPHESYCDFQSTLDEMQALSKIDFFPKYEESWHENLALELGCSTN